MDVEKVVKIDGNSDNSFVCKRCGFDQRKSFTPLTDELKKSYFRAALSQTPFRHTYDAFGGMLKVTFEEATGKLLQMQEHVMVKRNENGDIAMSDAMDFALLPSLVSIVHHFDEDATEKVVYEATPEQREEALKSGELPEALAQMPIVQLQTIRNLFAEFAKVCADLVVASQDENFWKGVGRN